MFGKIRTTLAHWFPNTEQRAPSDLLLLWLLRGIYGAIVIGLALYAFRHFQQAEEIPDRLFRAWLSFFSILGVGILIVLTDVLIRNKQITTISAIYFGLLLGLLLGNILATALEPFLFDWEASKLDQESGQKFSIKLHPEKDSNGNVVGHSADVNLKGSSSVRGQRFQQERLALSILLTVVCCYISISVLLQTKDEFRFIIPYVEFSRQVKGAKPLVLDTSVIIDGRIADICDTRFIDTKLIVPRFVLQELQSVADSSDKLKRNRGRRGLDMLKRMQNNPKVELQIHDTTLPEMRDVHKVDERLVVLAKVLGARVVTNDYNLNKIAQLQGVEVINLNELANSLKSVALPGEAMVIRVVKPGDQMGQGVGYLEDGTMVVVEQGRSHIGHEVCITVTSVLQTPAGRMIFGRVEPRANGPASSGGSSV